MESSAVEKSTCEDDGPFCQNNTNTFYKRERLVTFIQQKLPITVWLRNYKRSYFYYDCISGITVGLMAIPQCLAYGALAGLPAENGLYPAIICPFLYCLFGGAKELSISPVGVVSMVVAQYTGSYANNAMYISTLALFCGLVLVILSLMRLGLLVNFISIPVFAGFTSGVALKIVCVQLKDILGLKLPKSTFVISVWNTFNKIMESSIGDVVLGLSSILLYFLLKKFSTWHQKRKIKQSDSCFKRMLHRGIWFFCTARYSLVVIILTFITHLVGQAIDKDVFSVVGKMNTGLPKPQIPIRSYTIANSTTVSVLDVIKDIWPASFVTAFVAFLNTFGAVQILANEGNYKVNMSQEMFTLGLVTLMCSFFSGMPVAGSLSRSYVGSQCGAKTPLNGIFASCVIILALSVLTPWFMYIPKAALAAMVISAIVPLIDLTTLLVLWRARSKDIIAMVVTFFVVFYDTGIGLIAGVGVSLIFFLYHNSKLPFEMEYNEDAVIVHLKLTNLMYPSTETFVEAVEEIMCSHRDKDIVVDFGRVSVVDPSFAIRLKKLMNTHKEKAIDGHKFLLKDLSAHILESLVYFGVDTSTVSHEYVSANGHVYNKLNGNMCTHTTV